MTTRNLLIVAHILLLVWWLGGDLGQFLASFYVRRKELSADARVALAKLMVAIDVGPKICLVLMLPVAFSLADRFGAIALGTMEIAGLWIIAAVWLPTVIWLHFRPGQGQLFRKLDLWFRVLLIVGLVTMGVTSLIGDGVVQFKFVALKMILYATAIAGGIGIRLTITGFGPALGRLVTEGSSPEVEEAISASLRPAYFFVALIWACLIGATFLGVFKPL